MANFGARIDANAHVRPADKVRPLLRVAGGAPAAARARALRHGVVFLGAVERAQPEPRGDQGHAEERGARRHARRGAARARPAAARAAERESVFPPPPGPLLRVDAGDGIGCWIIVAPSAIARGVAPRDLRRDRLFARRRLAVCRVVARVEARRGRVRRRCARRRGAAPASAARAGRLAQLRRAARRRAGGDCGASAR